MSPPDAREQVLLGDDARARAHEDAHDLKLLSGEVHGRVRAGEVVRGEVERDVGEGDLVEHDVAAATRERAQAGEKLGRLEGLGHVVVRPGVEPADLVLGRGPRGQHEDRDRDALAAQLVDELGAVHAGKHHVEHDGVVRAREGGAKAAAPVVEGLGVVGVTLEYVHDGVGEVAFVLNHQYVHGKVLSVCCGEAASTLLSYPAALNFF